MKSSLFTKGFKILIVTLLLLAVLFNRSLAQKTYAGHNPDLDVYGHCKVFEANGQKADRKLVR